MTGAHRPGRVSGLGSRGSRIGFAASQKEWGDGAMGYSMRIPAGLAILRRDAPLRSTVAAAYRVGSCLRKLPEQSSVPL